ncbi:MAG: sigma-70 family RNA polymerase sigma factor [Verrucomicrobiota bacterium]
MKTRDIDYLQRFYVTHRQALFTYALSQTGQREAAEDVVQDVFVKLLERPRPPKNLRPYVFRMVRNRAIDRARRREARPEAIIDVDLHSEDDPDRDLMSWLQQGLDALDESEREVIVLKTMDDLSFREIAQVMDKPQGTVASWHRRGLERLRHILEKETIS